MKNAPILVSRKSNDSFYGPFETPYQCFRLEGPILASVDTAACLWKCLGYYGYSNCFFSTMFFLRLANTSIYIETFWLSFDRFMVYQTTSHLLLRYCFALYP